MKNKWIRSSRNIVASVSLETLEFLVPSPIRLSLTSTPVVQFSQRRGQPSQESGPNTGWGIWSMLPAPWGLQNLQPPSDGTSTAERYEFTLFQHLPTFSHLNHDTEKD
ncbi:hypothetical protein LAZ67_2001615 [Cordylochernes scorpioides]|uniref:Uncharacterized protein n=1 Tax=Cordylochernes scorpioides TaxID=51811 RepID=A0ABY6K649_9ARAC|nr:hypothetical protein LAZ67_2001615 [Cordylochernes scorpioides]